jgi:hypothetical protein
MKVIEHGKLFVMNRNYQSVLYGLLAKMVYVILISVFLIIIVY